MTDENRKQFIKDTVIELLKSDDEFKSAIWDALQKDSIYLELETNPGMHLTSDVPVPGRPGVFNVVTQSAPAGWKIIKP